MIFDYEVIPDIQRQVAEWHKSVWPECTNEQLIEKAKDEFQEWLDDPSDITEIADVILVLMAYAGRNRDDDNPLKTDIQCAMSVKFDRNRKLTRAEWDARDAARGIH